MNSSITLKLDGRYHCLTRLQDDRAEQFCATEDEARKWCKGTEKICNGNDIKKRDIPLYREKQVVQTVIERERI